MSSPKQCPDSLNRKLAYVYKLAFFKEIANVVLVRQLSP